MKTGIVCRISASIIVCVLASYISSARAADFPVRFGVQYGLASWYGPRFQGHLMACGERFDEYAMVAAHPTLPLGAKVEVTNLRSGRSVVVRIMDRGPYVAGRAIDVSKAAAERLRFTHRGLARVRIRVLSTPGTHPGEAEGAEKLWRKYHDAAPPEDQRLAGWVPHPASNFRE